MAPEPEPTVELEREPSALEAYGRDLTEEAEAGSLDPVIGRDSEIRNLIKVLSRRSKNNPVLIGEPGVGKTAIIMGKLRSMPEEYTFSVINVNYYTNFNSLMKQLEGPLEKKAGKNFGPPGNKKLIYFVDDLNMAALDNYNTASNISLMRQAQAVKKGVAHAGGTPREFCTITVTDGIADRTPNLRAS